MGDNYLCGTEFSFEFDQTMLTYMYREVQLL